MKRFLRLAILALVRVLGWPGIQRAQRRARTDKTMPARILLVRPDHLGDLILTTPVLQALREHAPDAELTMMVGPWSREIVARHPALNHVLTCAFPGFQRAAQGALAPYVLLFKTARQLRRERYDLALNLRPDFWWGAALLYLAGIPTRVGYALQPGVPFLSHPLAFPAAEHAAVSNLRLASAGLAALGYEPLAEPFTPERYPARFTPTPEEEAWVSSRLRAEGIEEGAPLIVIPPGSGGSVKLWRSEAWAACANTLRATLTSPHQARILVTGSPAERPLVEEVAQGIPEGATLVTDASIGQLAALLARARCVLTVDNGPGHIAAAQGTPGVHLFGPTDSRIFGPWGSATRHTILASTQRCPGCPAIPCGRLDWSKEELDAHPCVRVISEQQVLAAAEKLLGIGQVQTN
ncbi:MAG TPA: glycosyltransferase family 9 protein [Ktedonobacteraceae bacterium]